MSDPVAHRSEDKPMNAGIAKATKDVQSTFDRVSWTQSALPTPRALATHVSRTGRHSQMPLSAEDSALEFYRALGVALTVISELEEALRNTQDVAGGAIDRVIELTNGTP